MVRKVVVDRLEVMQQCHSSTAARKRPEPVDLGLHVTNIWRIQIFADWD